MTANMNADTMRLADMMSRLVRAQSQAGVHQCGGLTIPGQRILGYLGVQGLQELLNPVLRFQGGDADGGDGVDGCVKFVVGRFQLLDEQLLVGIESPAQGCQFGVEIGEDSCRLLLDSDQGLCLAADNGAHVELVVLQAGSDHERPDGCPLFPTRDVHQLSGGVDERLFDLEDFLGVFVQTFHPDLQGVNHLQKLVQAFLFRF